MPQAHPAMMGLGYRRDKSREDPPGPGRTNAWVKSGPSFLSGFNIAMLPHVSMSSADAEVRSAIGRLKQVFHYVWR